MHQNAPFLCEIYKKKLWGVAKHISRVQTPPHWGGGHNVWPSENQIFLRDYIPEPRSQGRGRGTGGTPVFSSNSVSDPSLAVGMSDLYLPSDKCSTRALHRTIIVIPRLLTFLYRRSMSR